MTKIALFFLFVASRLYALSVHVTDETSADKEEVTCNVLNLQKSWQVSIWQKQPYEVSKEGFLFVQMKKEELLGLLDKKKAKILWVEDEGSFLGYLILAPIEEFFDLYVNSPIRTFDCHVDQSLFTKEVQYIEQIAVKKDAVNRGVGTLLVNEAKCLSPYGLVAAVLVEPFPNLASLAFFFKNGFMSVGFLHCIECPSWPAYKTCVLHIGKREDVAF